jgi:hypothetical protein
VLSDLFIFESVCFLQVFMMSKRSISTACALESLLKVEPTTTILIDDYMGRNYKIVERFAELTATHDRVAEFRKRKDFDAAACRRALDLEYANLD